MDSGFVFWRPPGKSLENRMDSGIAGDSVRLESFGRVIYGQLVDDSQAAWHQGCWG
jgi:hypothetical protein